MERGLGAKKRKKEDKDMKSEETQVELAPADVPERSCGWNNDQNAAVEQHR